MVYIICFCFGKDFMTCKSPIYLMCSHTQNSKDIPKMAFLATKTVFHDNSRNVKPCPSCPKSHYFSLGSYHSILYITKPMVESSKGVVILQHGVWNLNLGKNAMIDLVKLSMPKIRACATCNFVSKKAIKDGFPRGSFCSCLTTLWGHLCHQITISL